MTDKSYLLAGIAGYPGRPDETGDVGVFRREVGSGQWRHVFGDCETFAVHVHAGDPSVVFAGTEDGVFRSTDHGATFARADFPDKDKQIWSFMVDSRDDDRIYAGSSPIGVFLSDDRGGSWRQLSDVGVKDHCKVTFDSRVMRVVQHPTRPDEIFGALEVNGVIRSIDGGLSWEDCSEHLIELSRQVHLKSKIVSDSFSEGMLDTHAITISPANPDDVILAVRMGLFRSKDRGKTWMDMEIGRFSPMTYSRDLRVSALDPRTMYAALSVAAASHDGGVYRSTDAGETWRRFDKVQVHGTIMSIGLHPRDADQVYIGARYDGEVFGTVDGGKTWIEMSIPGSVKHLYSLSCG